MAAKKDSSHSHSIWNIAIVILIVVLVIIAAKFWHSKTAWEGYGMKMQDKIMTLPSADAGEDGTVIATTLTMLPSISKPLYENTKDLQSYISVISKQTGRDLVVVDVDKFILADTDETNAGNLYTSDKDNEVLSTIQDGKTRNFTASNAETSGESWKTVVAMKDDNGEIVGAVILSPSKNFK